MRDLVDKLRFAASTLVQAAANFRSGPEPTSGQGNGDVGYNSSTGFWGWHAGSRVSLMSAASLGRFTDSIASATAGQTTIVLTHTPASIQDIDQYVNGWKQDNSNITGLAGKTITFNALTAGWSADFEYTRLD
jgi:hypothetical protein